MKSVLTDLSKVKLNKKNPRQISPEKFEKLINSVLSLPKMLEMRPVVIDKNGTALGGNMRYRALEAISKMTEKEINKRLDTIRDVKKKSDKERADLKAYWEEWLKQPQVPTLDASTLTKAEQREFIIKDNGDFGAWDYDMLANEWEAEDLNDWGVDVWQQKEVVDPFKTSDLAAEERNEEAVAGAENLPAELQGLDLDPNALPKIEGKDEVPFERLILVYPADRKEEVKALLGLNEISKVVYHIDEIINGGEQAE